MSMRRAQHQLVSPGKQGVWQCAPSPRTAISPATDFSATGMDLFNMFTFDIDSLPADGHQTYPSSNMDDIPLEDLFTTEFSYFPSGGNNSTLAHFPAASFEDWTEPNYNMDDAAFFNDAIDPNLAADMSQWGWENTQQLHVDIPSPELYSTIYPTPSPSTATSSPCISQLSPGPSPPSTLKSVGAFTCPDDSCSRSFTTQNLLRQVHPHPLPGPEANLRSYRKHKRKHTKPFVCSVCTKGHAAKKDLHRHMWVRHPEAAEQAGLPSEVRRCSVRGCTFEGRQDNLTRHLRTKHRDG